MRYEPSRIKSHFSHPANSHQLEFDSKALLVCASSKLAAFLLKSRSPGVAQYGEEAIEAHRSHLGTHSRFDFSPLLLPSFPNAHLQIQVITPEVLQQLGLGAHFVCNVCTVCLASIQGCPRHASNAGGNGWMKLPGSEQGFSSHPIVTQRVSSISSLEPKPPYLLLAWPPADFTQESLW